MTYIDNIGGFPIQIGTQIKIAKLYVISKLIWNFISIGNPPYDYLGM